MPADAANKKTITLSENAMVTLAQFLILLEKRGELKQGAIAPWQRAMLEILANKLNHLGVEGMRPLVAVGQKELAQKGLIRLRPDGTIAVHAETALKGLFASKPAVGTKTLH